MLHKRIYLDWNATAPILEVARQSFIKTLYLCGNPSSIHREGQKVHSCIEDARHVIADFCDAKFDNVVFTSCATESANWILTPNFYKGSQEFRIGSLYVSGIEHSSVYAGGQFSADMIHKIPVLPEGIVDIKALANLLNARDDSLNIPMVAVMLVNHETGVIQPIKEVANIVKQHQGILVVDAVQAAGRIPVSINDLGADFIIISAHKLGAPMGVGALIFQNDILLPRPLLRGGSQEMGHRAGTENFAAICGFSAAVKEIGKNIQERSYHMSMIKNYLEEGLNRLIPNIIIYGKDANRVSNTCYFSIPSLKAELLQLALDIEGIAVSTGSACLSGKIKKNHVLSAMGYDISNGAIRISFGYTTTQEDIDTLLEKLHKIIK
ncbi:MAG: cysteine desulfurase [Candidatus Liberibacter europaeus]|uniref:Cysteine desulfurase n=1 Tax=Candidatus Liberibacter europaeus TaxID=744859 RepID=A0A2T4VWD1_9HYPH|nr:cysteine desulfurase [Candidatus Liberibacter europaeus]PTL86060.1 MAG: cysteine desulfurase [Candidatus Liberibacter europaeus]